MVNPAAVCTPRINTSCGDGLLVARIDSSCVSSALSLPVSGVGMALLTDAGPAGTVAGTDGSALELEDLPLSLGDEPCKDASQSGRPVLPPGLGRTAGSAGRCSSPARRPPAWQRSRVPAAR